MAATLDEPNLVGIDMGGTSFDVCVVRKGASTVVTEGEIDGLPVRVPMVEIRTVGAGGVVDPAAVQGGQLAIGAAELLRERQRAHERLAAVNAPNKALYDRLESIVGSFCPGLAKQPYHLHRFGAPPH